MASFNNVLPGSSADSSCIQQVIDALKGTAGKGVPITPVAVNDSANYALDVENQDPNNQRALRIRDSSGGARLTVDGSPAVVTIDHATISSATMTNSTMSLLNANGNNVQVPQCRLTNTSTQTLTSGALTALTFNTERYDNDSLHSTAVTPSRITPSRAGLWGMGGGASIDANSSGLIALSVMLNGATRLAQSQLSNTALGVIMSVATEWQLSTSDYIELVVFQNSGGNLGTAAPSGNMFPEFWATYRGSS